jgi:PTH1 family peptidyl-tRNA hydrolase
MYMEKKDFLVVGLGNPGVQYFSTRHNVGFMIADELASRWNLILTQEKWDAQCGSLGLEGKKVHLIKPLTFMNRTGKSVAQFIRFFKIHPDQLLVIHDDLDMAPGRVKLVKGGGAGGHNGIKSLVDALGKKDFYRLKIGIGRPGQGGVHPDFPVEKYVLSNFTVEDANILHSRYQGLDDGIRSLLQGDPGKAMTFLNSLK